jgi:hypothetical protein
MGTAADRADVIKALATSVWDLRRREAHVLGYQFQRASWGWCARLNGVLITYACPRIDACLRAVTADARGRFAEEIESLKKKRDTQCS